MNTRNFLSSKQSKSKYFFLMFFVLFNQLNIEGRISSTENKALIKKEEALKKRKLKEEVKAIKKIRRRIEEQLTPTFKNYIEDKKKIGKVAPKKYDYHLYLDTLSNLTKATPSSVKEEDLLYMVSFFSKHLKTLQDISPLTFQENLKEILKIIDLELIVTPKQKINENYKYALAIKDLTRTFYKNAPIQEIRQIIGKDPKEINPEVNLSKFGLPTISLKIDDNTYKYLANELTLMLKTFLEINKEKKTEKYKVANLQAVMTKLNKSISEKKEEEETDLLYFARNITKYIKSKKKTNFKVDEYMAFTDLIQGAFNIIQLKKIDSVSLGLQTSEEEIKKIESETISSEEIKETEDQKTKPEEVLKEKPANLSISSSSTQPASLNSLILPPTSTEKNKNPDLLAKTTKSNINPNIKPEKENKKNQSLNPEKVKKTKSKAPEKLNTKDLNANTTKGLNTKISNSTLPKTSEQEKTNIKNNKTS